jgi:fermentation-respiration switch protein FrsA (DUF1100 family)
VELRGGIDLDELEPRKVVGRLAPRPLLLIHGGADEVVPPGDADEIFAAAGQPKQLWRVEGAAHGDTLRPGGATASERVVAFLREALNPEAAAADGS